MKLTYRALATLLVAVMAAYATTRESSGVCQVPHPTIYRVLR